MNVMTSEISTYLDRRNIQVKAKISRHKTERTTETILNTLFSCIQRSLPFQRYYLKTVCNRQYFLSSSGFFRDFNRQYALRVDTGFVDELEKKKLEILQLIDDDQLATLYFDCFASAQITRKGDRVTRDLGSFFTKLVHTFEPSEYCALDNPVKSYFELPKESFFIAFLIVSRAYREWADENREFMQLVRQGISQTDEATGLQSDRMTDLKILDLIFWCEANLAKK